MYQVPGTRYPMAPPATIYATPAVPGTSTVPVDHYAGTCRSTIVLQYFVTCRTTFYAGLQWSYSTTHHLWCAVPAYATGYQVLAATRYVLSTMLVVGPTPPYGTSTTVYGTLRYQLPPYGTSAYCCPWDSLQSPMDKFLFLSFTAIFGPLYDCHIHLTTDRHPSTFYGNLRPPLWLPYLTDKRQTVNFTALQHHCIAILPRPSFEKSV